MSVRAANSLCGGIGERTQSDPSPRKPTMYFFLDAILDLLFIFFYFSDGPFTNPQDFANGNFLAVQWRTETATGDMAQCYEQVLLYC